MLIEKNLPAITNELHISQIDLESQEHVKSYHTLQWAQHSLHMSALYFLTDLSQLQELCPCHMIKWDVNLALSDMPTWVPTDESVMNWQPHITTLPCKPQSIYSFNFHFTYLLPFELTGWRGFTAAATVSILLFWRSFAAAATSSILL